MPITNTTDLALILASAVDIVERHMTGTYRRQLRAFGNVSDLHNAGLLVDGNAKTDLPVREQAVNLLQCRNDWPTAERIVADLAEAGLLKTEES